MYWLWRPAHAARHTSPAARLTDADRVRFSFVFGDVRTWPTLDVTGTHNR